MMHNLPWQFVAITSTAMLATAIAGAFSESSAIIVAGIGLLYGQALNYAKSSQVQTVVENRTDTLKSDTQNQFQHMERVNHQAANRVAEATVEAAVKVAEQAAITATTAIKSVQVPTATEIAQAVVAEVKKGNS